MATDTPSSAGPLEDAAIRCANCAIPIDGQAVVRDDRSYCCDGCADGGPCVC